MLPGFIDQHGHIVAASQSLIMPNFSGVTSIEEMINILKKALQERPFKENEWLLGLGYDNSKALELFGYVGNNYKIPEGGIVEKLDGTNGPSGVLEETAFLAPEKKKCIGSPSIDTVLKALVEA